MNAVVPRRIWIKRAKRGPMDESRSATLAPGRASGATRTRRAAAGDLISAERWTALTRAGDTSPIPARRRANLLVSGIDLEASRGRSCASAIAGSGHWRDASLRAHGRGLPGIAGRARPALGRGRARGSDQRRDHRGGRRGRVGGLTPGVSALDRSKGDRCQRLTEPEMSLSAISHTAANGSFLLEIQLWFSADG